MYSTFKRLLFFIHEFCLNSLIKKLSLQAICHFFNDYSLFVILSHYLYFTNFCLYFMSMNYNFFHFVLHLSYLSISIIYFKSFVIFDKIFFSIVIKIFFNVHLTHQCDACSLLSLPDIRGRRNILRLRIWTKINL